MSIYLYVIGDKSSIGKSTTCLSILSALLSSGYASSALCYIKPSTQCEGTQLVSNFCASKGIKYKGLGPIRYYKGFTYKVIEGSEASDLLGTAVQAVRDFSVGATITLVDGVGYPSVGSFGSVSSVQVAKELNAKVIFVGKPGVGDAIDSFNLCKAYFEKYSVAVMGVVFNGLSKEDAEDARHTYANCKKYVTMYFQKTYPAIAVYGFVPQLGADAHPTKDRVCVLEEEVVPMDEEQTALAAALTSHFREYVDFQRLIEDLTL